MEESLEEEPQSINAEEIHEDITDEIEDYFTDSSEEFNDAEQIESATHGIGMDSDSDEENNSNDSSDSDSEDTNSLSKAFFKIKNSTINIPFLSNPNFYENDHLLAIIAISMRNNLSFEATLSILSWMKLTHNNNNLPTTKKALWKALNRDDTLITRHLYCVKTTCSVDSPARSLNYEKLKQFNGYNGCSFCYAMENIVGNKHIYPRSHSYGNYAKLMEEIAKSWFARIRSGVRDFAAECLHVVFFGSCKTAYKYIS
ncbi:hypothetical protein KQX54_000778 [Cotesia glomerata]|uniref:Uncharacterized protein n=1 Tax=Cotesia glomerata TaxID=32391 RepID=A0AAV7I752_COTGL|nr:hypothetical protein KQX54_000778 [Cotesia glomerata]